MAMVGKRNSNVIKFQYQVLNIFKKYTTAAFLSSLLTVLFGEEEDVTLRLVRADLRHDVNDVTKLRVFNVKQFILCQSA